MIKEILAEAIIKMNAMTVPQLKKEGADIKMIIDVRDELIALKRTYEDYLRGKL